MTRVIALGFFDGVHLGHRTLLARTRAAADRLGASAAAMTFDRSPGKGGVLRELSAAAGYGGVHQLIRAHGSPGYGGGFCAAQRFTRVYFHGSRCSPVCGALFPW